MNWASPKNTILDEPLTYPSHYPKTIKLLETVRHELTLMDNLYRFGLHQQLLKLCGVAREMIEHPARWDDFARVGWIGMKPPKRDDSARALYHVFRWVFGGSHGAIQKASFYFRALGPLLEKGLILEEIEQALSNKGLRKLADEHVDFKPKLKTKKVTAFKAKKYKKLWNIPAKVRFDHDPQHLFGLSGDSFFSMTGRIKIDGEKCEIIAMEMKISEDLCDVLAKAVSD